MRHALIAVLGVFAGLAGSVFAADSANVDLTKIDRVPPKLPTLHSDHPEYCLLVFGADAHKRVWLVRDGNVLYVDRHGTGDLTEPGERIEADADTSQPDEGILYFKAGDVPDGTLLHKDLRVSWYKLNHLVDEDPRVKALLELNPKWRGCTIQVDIDMPGQHGGGLDGRVVEKTSWQDKDGLLQFASRPELSPIVHFAGPWLITLWSQELWHIGTTEKQYLAVGTPGSAPGTTAYVDYGGVIPAELTPMLRVTFPRAAASGTAMEKSYELTKRCCGINLYGNIDIPADIGTGKAQVEVSLANWPGVTVASTTHTVNIAPAEPLQVKLEPVSWRLKSSLPHVNKGKSNRDCIVQIQFSPDGNRLIAGDYRGGVVQVWDVASGKQLLTIDTGPGSPRDFEYFAVSPDWRYLYAPTIARNLHHEKIEKDGQVLNRWAFDDAVQAFDLNTGKLVREYQFTPPKGITWMQLAPDGRYILTDDELPGEYEGNPTRARSLWNVKTGEHQQVFDSFPGMAAFSPDSKTVAASFSKSRANSTYTDSMKVFDFLALTDRTRIMLPEGLISATPLAFTADGKVIMGTVTTYETRGDDEHHRSALKLWNATSGQELCSVPAREKNESFDYVAKVSPDSKTIAIANFPAAGQRGILYLVDVTACSARSVDLGEDVIPQHPVFHPGGKWVAVRAPVVPKQQRTNSDPPFEELPQPRIAIVDVTTGKVAETLIAPQCYINSLAFSPDGNTLASGGAGEVLLWDFSTPPGEKQP